MSILSQQKQSVNTDFPNLRPSLDLRFALAKKLDPRITFTRGSTGTYFGSDGLMKTAGVNEPRFDHDPITGQSLGLLIEESRQNLLKYSNSFNTGGAGNWQQGGAAAAVFTQNQTGPDGVANSAWTIDDNYALFDGAGFEQRISITPSTTTNYCLSIFAKKGTSSFFDFYAFFIGTSTKASYLRYNFDTDTVTVFSSDGGGITPTIYGKIQYPNDWYRLYFVVNDANSGLNNQLYFRLYPGSRNTGRTGNTLFYGAQLETGEFPTSYIPTTTSSVTRSADTAQMLGTNFSSWYNPNEGTIVISTDKLYSGNFDNYRHYYQIGDATATNVFGTIYTNINTTFITNYGTTNGGRQVFDYQQISIGSSPTQFKVGQSINSKYSFFTSSKGTTTPQLPSRSAPNSHNNTTPTSVDRMWIGRKVSGGEINSHISRLTYYPIQLTNQQLINLTS